MNWIFKNINWIAIGMIIICLIFWICIAYFGVWVIAHPEAIARWLIRAGFTH